MSDRGKHPLEANVRAEDCAVVFRESPAWGASPPLAPSPVRATDPGKFREKWEAMP